MKRQWAVPPPPFGNTHETAFIEHGNLQAWVDRKMVPIILACWKAGITTLFSCEETDPGLAFIGFKESISMGRFVEIVSKAEVDRTIFTSLNESRVMKLWTPAYLSPYHVCGYKNVDLPVWTHNDGMLIPVDYLSAYTKALES